MNSMEKRLAIQRGEKKLPLVQRWHKLVPELGIANGGPELAGYAKELTTVNREMRERLANELRTDSLVASYCDSNALKIPQPVDWEAWQRVADRATHIAQRIADELLGPVESGEQEKRT